MTAHGVLQAQRLAAHLVERSSVTGPISHVFSSDLQRAERTAQAIIDQASSRSIYGASDSAGRLRLVRVPDIRERDFRSGEGKRFGTPHQDAETHEEMRVRAARFIETHLSPLLYRRADASPRGETSVIVVAHGIILNAILRVLLTRFAPAELGRLSRSSASGRSEYLATWSNTGYLEAVVRALPLPAPAQEIAFAGSSSAAVSSTISRQRPPRIRLAIVRINSVDHLQGLRKTRGGIGSAAYDGPWTRSSVPRRDHLRHNMGSTTYAI